VPTFPVRQPIRPDVRASIPIMAKGQLVHDPPATARLGRRETPAFFAPQLFFAKGVYRIPDPPNDLGFNFRILRNLARLNIAIGVMGAGFADGDSGFYYFASQIIIHVLIVKRNNISCIYFLASKNIT